MSIKKNIIANYFGQFYVTLIGIFLVPLYLKYMGAEAYGLVGFYATLQAWFFMLDMGLTPTMARDCSRFLGGVVDATNLRRLLRALEGIFLLVAIVGVVAIVAGSSAIAAHWLKVNELPMYEVTNSIVIIAFIVSLRWMGGLYRGAINGFERIVWLNIFNIVIATLRFVLIIPILAYIDAAATTFFLYQLVVTTIETIVLVLKTYRLLPPASVSTITGDWKQLRASLKFSSSIAFAGLVWVTVTQTDKLLLSGLIPLADYAYYTIAVLAASGIMVISKPVSGALLPRMTVLNAEGNQVQLLKLYENATQIVAVIAVPSAVVLALFSDQVLLAWIGDAEIAHKAAPVLLLYAFGNGVMVLAAFPYYLQYAKGDLKLHFIGNALFVSLFVPSIYYSVTEYGVLGAGYAWLVSNAMLFLFLLPIVHRKFAKGLHLKWLAHDIGVIAVPPLIFALIAKELVEWPADRVALALYICLLFAVALALAAISSAKMRALMRVVYTKKR